MATTGVVVCALIAIAGTVAYASVHEHGNPYARYQFAIGVSCIAVGLFVARRRPDHPLGFVLLGAGGASLLTFAGSSVLDWLLREAPDQEFLGRVVLHSSTWGSIVTRYGLTALAPLVYPGGCPRTPWTRMLWWAGLATIVVTATAHGRLFTFEYFAGEPPVATTARLAAEILPWGHRIAWVIAVAALLTMSVNVARLGGGDRRHLPFAAALALLIVPIVDSIYAEAFDAGGFLHHDGTLELWAMALLPVVLSGGIFFAHALDIDVVLRRTTTYLALASIAAVVYVAVVWVFSLFVQEGAGAGSVVATGVIAAGVIPAHATVERLVARRVFGDRANPYAVVAAVGDRLEHALQSIVDTLGEQLRLPFVAVEVTAGDTTVETARWGVARPPVDGSPWRSKPNTSASSWSRNGRNESRSARRSAICSRPSPANAASSPTTRPSPRRSDDHERSSSRLARRNGDASGATSTMASDPPWRRCR